MHHTETAPPAQANPWVAALLSLVVPGLGQLYLGRWVTALVLHLGWLGIMAVWVFWAMGSFPATLATAGVAVAWLLVATVSAAALGRQRPMRPTYPWLGRWPALLGLVLLANGVTELTLLRLLPSRYDLLTMSAASMVPTLLPGELFVGDMRAFHDHLPARRDLVLIGSPKDTQVIWILRCVGIPGDVVEVRDRQLLVNGEPQVGAHLPRTPSVGRLDDPYHLDRAGPVLLQEGQLFCLGDNWDNSLDSRYFGPMPVTALRGKPLYRLMPDQRSRLGQPLADRCCPSQWVGSSPACTRSKSLRVSTWIQVEWAPAAVLTWPNWSGNGGTGSHRREPRASGGPTSGSGWRTYAGSSTTCGAVPPVADPGR